MPYTEDVRSLVEQSFIGLLSSPDVVHAHRSAQGRVADLAESLAPAPTSKGPRAHSSGDDGSAEHFQGLMASALASFEGAQRVKGLADDHQLEALARLHATALAELDARHSQSWVDRTPLSAREAVVMEVAAATGLGHADLSLRLELAIGSPARTSFLREQVRSGESTLQRACEIVRETRELTDELVDQVARAALAPTRDGAGLPGPLFRQRLRRAVLAADSDQVARRRAARRRNGAHAEVWGDGTGRLTITNDAEAIVAAIERADSAARAARASGDPRSLDQLRADFLTGVAIHGWPDGDEGFARSTPAPAGQAVVVVPFSTAFGLDDSPCELPGHGFISAAQAREIITAPGSVWQTLLADVDTGRALALSRTAYRPSREMVEHIRAVDGVCRGPGCTVPAHRCDLDHAVPWPQGPTAASNLIASHRAHHRLRTAGWWTGERDDNARVTWHTAAGRTYTTHAADWLEGLRARAPSPAPPTRPATDRGGGDPPPF